MPDHTNGEHYTGPAGVVLTPEECLLIWKNLVHCNEDEIRDLRHRLKRFLEGRECLTS